MNRKTHIEIVKQKKSFPNYELIDLAWNYIFNNPAIISQSGGVINCQDIPELSEKIQSITIGDVTDLPTSLEELIFHVYSLTESGQNIIDITDNNGSDSVTASNHWLLPNTEFHGLWESLIYDDSIKENLLKYVETIMHFSNRSVDPNLISCNRLVLLHGPPGTGKTSLCKAIAQKLAIRFNETYHYVHLVEINSHSLFSKWFSESGKLVMKLFEQIREIIEHKESLVCILIDEIESIAFERNSMSSAEPSDSLRVVNAVLTQLDQIRNFSNVLILTTSNITSAIDCAFLDRADIRQYIGPPNSAAIMKIYSSIINELMHRNVIAECELTDEIQSDLRSLADLSVGISGRTLRKIPILAVAFYTDHDSGSIPLPAFLEAMRKAIEKHICETRQIDKIPIKVEKGCNGAS